MLDKNLKKNYKKDQESFYTERFNSFGLIVQADGWTTEMMANYYYEKVKDLLIDHCASKPFSLLEIGSGHGFFYKYLKSFSLLDSIHYSGIEINEESFKQAQSMNPEANYYYGDFLDCSFSETSFDYTVFLGTFSIFKSLSSEDFYKIVEANLNKAFAISNYATILLISKLVLPDESLDLLFKSASNISQFFDLNTTIFGDYLALALYKKKYVLDSYSKFKDKYQS